VVVELVAAPRLYGLPARLRHVIPWFSGVHQNVAVWRT